MDNTAFIKAVLDDPDNDAPRLIYADFLEENGQSARAELIRVQCAIAWPCRLGYSDAYHVDDVCESCDALRRRERDLLRRCYSWPQFGGYAVAPATYDPAIIKMFPPGGGWELVNVVFRRGFVAVVVCQGEVWQDHGDAILAEQPVEEVSLTSVPKINLRVTSEDVLHAEFSAAGGPWLGLVSWRGNNINRPVVQEALMARWPRVRRWFLPFPCRPFPPERFP